MLDNEQFSINSGWINSRNCRMVKWELCYRSNKLAQCVYTVTELGTKCSIFPTSYIPIELSTQFPAVLDLILPSVALVYVPEYECHLAHMYPTISVWGCLRSFGAIHSTWSAFDISFSPPPSFRWPSDLMNTPWQYWHMQIGSDLKLFISWYMTLWKLTENFSERSFLFVFNRRKDGKKHKMNFCWFVFNKFYELDRERESFVRCIQCALCIPV